MQVGHQVTSSTPLQIPPQPETAVLRSRQPTLLGTIQPFIIQAIIDPKRGMEGPVQPQTAQPPWTCTSPGPATKPCCSLDVSVSVLLVTLAGAVILLLLYRLLQLRHRLRLARAGHALEYYGFFHTATYTLKHPTPCEDLPTNNGAVPEEASLPIQTVSSVTPVTITPLPPPPVPLPPLLPLPPPPALPPAPNHPPPSLPTTHPVLALPLPLPVIRTTPPSPHLSWGACSDADVYSRIGAFRPSRLSSLSSQSKVILFEHSSF